MKKTSTASFDILGISSATLCLIHCLAFPLLTLIPLGVSHNPWIDLAFAAIGVFAVAKITKKSHVMAVKVILWSSITLILASVIADLLIHHHSNLMYVGATGLIIGHFINFRAHKH
ncbi:MerC domain-containing protein [Flavobacterium kingsejongi]|uniref:MerC mercury resistance protein n=1 Tax=Flavobacterium kingsejongi TaxID=1678728 RepID=A0A2S1LPK4_9FLAO|nr:MerC domain-containing protein [Flavobacterium kingsejongi]AWG25649.1 MerC mercury resistance protein [Flavobacterium kingsejongi]